MNGLPTQHQIEIARAQHENELRERAREQLMAQFNSDLRSARSAVERG